MQMATWLASRRAIHPPYRGAKGLLLHAGGGLFCDIQVTHEGGVVPCVTSKSRKEGEDGQKK